MDRRLNITAAFTSLLSVFLLQVMTSILETKRDKSLASLETYPLLGQLFISCPQLRQALLTLATTASRKLDVNPSAVQVRLMQLEGLLQPALL